MAAAVASVQARLKRKKLQEHNHALAEHALDPVIFHFVDICIMLMIDSIDTHISIRFSEGDSLSCFVRTRA